MKNIFTYLILLLSISSFAQTPTTGSFYPLAKGKYLVSGWVKEDYTQQEKAYKSTISIEFYDGTTLQSSLTKTFNTSGAVIDGWQRITGIIDIPDTLTDPAIAISLNCKATGTTDCYFDDIRFFPYNGNLKSFVYDEDTKKLMAELDENNYATFYEYDLEGGLVRVKKETDRGVFTIQETRSGTTVK